MRRYTTEFPNIIIPGIELAGAKVFVTFADLAGKEIMTVTDAEVTNTEVGTLIKVEMTQERSALFQANRRMLRRLSAFLQRLLSLYCG